MLRDIFGVFQAHDAVPAWYFFWTLIIGVLSAFWYKHKQCDILTEAIRKHRDQKLDDRCWLDDMDLYSVLNDEELPDFRLPPKAEFLNNCAQYQLCRATSRTPQEAAVKYAMVRDARCLACRCHPHFIMAGCQCECHK